MLEISIVNPLRLVQKHLTFHLLTLPAAKILATPLLSKCGCWFFYVLSWHYKYVLFLMDAPEQILFNLTEAHQNGEQEKEVLMLTLPI